MKRVAVAGNFIVDTIKMIERYPEKNMLATVSEIKRSVGGCVPNVAIDLKKFGGTDVSVYGRVGADGNGAFLLGELRAHGIDVSHVVTDEREATSFTDVMTERGGARTFFQYRGANARFDLSDIDVGSLSCELLHVGYAMLLDRLDGEDREYGTVMARLLAAVRARGIETSLDVVSETSARFARVVVPAVPYCDYIVLNESEGGLVTGIEPRRADGSVDAEKIKDILRAFVALGVKKKVVIHCPELGASLRPGGEPVVVPSLALPDGYIKGTVGAGDAYCAGILYSALHGAGDEEALEFAACAAACNLSVTDSVSGARSAEETLKLKALYGRNL